MPEVNFKFSAANLLKVLGENSRCEAHHSACEIPIGAHHVSQRVEKAIGHHLEYKSTLDFRVVDPNDIMSQHHGACRKYRQQDSDKERLCFELNLKWSADSFVVNRLEKTM